jgi:hypothetical protein
VPIAYVSLEVISLVFLIVLLIRHGPGCRKFLRLSREYNKTATWPKTARKVALPTRISLMRQMLQRRTTEPDPERAKLLVEYADCILGKRAMLAENDSGVVILRTTYVWGAIWFALQGAAIMAQGVTTSQLGVTISGCLMLVLAGLVLAGRRLLAYSDRRHRDVVQTILDENLT